MRERNALAQSPRDEVKMDPTEYARRRRELADKIGPDGVAVFIAPPERTRSNDTSYPYRASSDIVYLTGFTEPHTVLVISPGHDEGDVAMFVRARDPEKELWDGGRAGPEGAVADYGADVAYSTEELDEKLPELMKGRDTLWYTLGNDPEFDVKVAGWMNKLRYRRGEPPAAPRAIADARDLVHEMRLFKRPAELEVMRRAAQVTAEAHIIAMKRAQPGVHEYELQAAIEHHFKLNGASFPAYTSIVGAGANATVLHYVTNRDRIGEDDVILIDAGCELDFYAADITRSFPASGKFTPEQRDAYQAVLDVQKAAIEDVIPGLPYDELQTRTARRLSQALIDLGIVDASVDEIVEEEIYKQFYPHKVGHWLGIDVHDVGSYHDESGDWRPLEPGMVLTIEPGLYFPADADIPDGFRGVGIRIEDDILVTPDGRENLTATCPKEVADIEAIVGTEAHH